MAERELNAVKIGVCSPDEVKARTRAAFRGKPQGNRISFATAELMWKTLAPPRWHIVETMTGAGPMSIREVARRVGRDVKAVHGDVKKLLDNGVLDRTEDGKVVFPYDAVHVDFTITKAA
ncbi:MAG: transcriptional regulator [Pseudomonadota bacterium]|nr:transcriptional regulator [Pseudomonadota bacterium]